MNCQTYPGSRSSTAWWTTSPAGPSWPWSGKARRLSSPAVRCWARQTPTPLSQARRFGRVSENFSSRGVSALVDKISPPRLVFLSRAATARDITVEPGRLRRILAHQFVLAEERFIGASSWVVLIKCRVSPRRLLHPSGPQPHPRIGKSGGRRPFTGNFGLFRHEFPPFLGATDESCLAGYRRSAGGVIEPGHTRPTRTYAEWGRNCGTTQTKDGAQEFGIFLASLDWRFMASCDIS